MLLKREVYVGSYRWRPSASLAILPGWPQWMAKLEASLP